MIILLLLFAQQIISSYLYNVISNEVETKPNKAMNNQEITFVMFKIIGGKQEYNYKFTAMSDNHAVTVAENFYKKCGLFGRYYCETSNGVNFAICQ